MSNEENHSNSSGLAVDLETMDREASAFAFDSAGVGRLSCFVRQLVMKVRALEAAIRTFLGADGHELCHENRLVLARALGAADVRTPFIVSREEFEAGCKRYADEIYGCERGDALARLQAWVFGHKRRSCSIDQDDGYGASRWEVVLNGVQGADFGRVQAYESSQPSSKEDNGVVTVWDREQDDWPGLAAVVHAAIDRAEELEKKL